MEAVDKNVVRCSFQNDIGCCSDCQQGCVWAALVAEDIFAQLCERWSFHNEFVEMYASEALKHCER